MKSFTMRKCPWTWGHRKNTDLQYAIFRQKSGLIRTSRAQSRIFPVAAGSAGSICSWPSSAGWHSKWTCSSWGFPHFVGAFFGSPILSVDSGSSCFSHYFSQIGVEPCSKRSGAIWPQIHLKQQGRLRPLASGSPLAQADCPLGWSGSFSFDLLLPAFCRNLRARSFQWWPADLGYTWWSWSFSRFSSKSFLANFWKTGYFLSTRCLCLVSINVQLWKDVFPKTSVQCDLRPNRSAQNDRTLILSISAFHQQVDFDMFLLQCKLNNWTNTHFFNWKRLKCVFAECWLQEVLGLESDAHPS